MGWQTVEHWRRPVSGGYRNLWLYQLTDVFANGWRIEWDPAGIRKGETFSVYDLGDLDECERRARQLLAERLAEATGWEQVV